MADADAIVIGSGPNGLVAAAHLARAGMRVLVLEAARVPGGAARTAELTLPGYAHDVGAAFFPFGEVSPALMPLALGEVGLRFRHAEMDSAHPAPDGTCAAIGRDPDATARAFGVDGDRFREIQRWITREHASLLPALLGSFPAIGAGLAMGVDNGLTLASIAMHSGRSFGSRFQSEAARRVVPGLGLHADVGPDDPFGAVVGFMLAALASCAGFPVAEGGAGSITSALQRRVEEHGGEIVCGTHVDEILVHQGRAVAVRTSEGEEIAAKRAIVADVGAPALYLKMLARAHVPARLVRSMERYPYAWGTFKMDWALDGPVPWKIPICRRSAVVHVGDSVDDLARFTREVRAGKLPARPYLVIGQQSLCDPTRAPAGKHVLYGYTHVPSYLEGGWAAHREAFADSIEERLEELAPGFRALVAARSIHAPPDLEAMNENLVGGDLGGGTAQITNQLCFRPSFPWFGHRTPVRGLYLGSSYAHPGTGVHGACGWNAAMAALADA